MSTIVKCTVEDSSSLFECAERNLPKLFTLYELQHILSDEEFLTFCIKKNNSDQILAYLIGKDIEDNTFDIYYFAVEKDYRRQGLGTKLMKYVIDNLKEDITNITLQTQIDNEAAIKFYQRNGFKIMHILKDYYYENDMEKDGYELKYTRS